MDRFQVPRYFRVFPPCLRHNEDHGYTCFLRSRTYLAESICRTEKTMLIQNDSLHAQTKLNTNYRGENQLNARTFSCRGKLSSRNKKWWKSIADFQLIFRDSLRVPGKIDEQMRKWFWRIRQTVPWKTHSLSSQWMDSLNQQRY